MARLRRGPSRASRTFGPFANTLFPKEALMDSTLDIFPCDLGEPILIPETEMFEAAHESGNRSTFETPFVPSQDQDAPEWADIT